MQMRLYSGESVQHRFFVEVDMRTQENQANEILFWTICIELWVVCFWLLGCAQPGTLKRMAQDSNQPPPRLSTPTLQKVTLTIPPLALQPTRVADFIPTLEPVVGLGPGTEWMTYVEPNFGFSFRYPNNWHIDAPKKRRAAVKRISIIVQNYKDVVTKGDKTIEQLKIDLDVLPLPRSIPDLRAWSAQMRDPKLIGAQAKFSISPLEKIEIDSVPAVRWIQTGDMIPQGSITVGAIKDERLYVMTAYPATSRYIAVFDQIVSSLVFP